MSSLQQDISMRQDLLLTRKYGNMYLIFSLKETEVKAVDIP